MSLKSSWSRIRNVCAIAVAVGAAGAVTNFVGCTSSNSGVPVTTVTTTSYAVVDPYLYTVYYPADIAYSSYYWVDSWAYPTLYQVYGPAPTTSSGAAGTTGSGAAGTTGKTTKTDAGVATVSAVTTAADAIRALARGESVCPGQVTVTARMAALSCTGGPASVRTGVAIAFNNCKTAGGGTLNGMVDVTSTHTASATTCTSTTMITSSHTTTITNLSFTGTGGRQLLIPSQTGTGMSTYTFGATPATISLNWKGQLQTFASAGGSTTSDHNYTGTGTFSFGGSTSHYTLNGTVTVVNNLMAGAGTSITATNLTRTTSCCRPVGGTINIMQTSGTGVGSHVIGFGPSCGEATLDGTSSMLPACI
jgi:hypothetical protein